MIDPPKNATDRAAGAPCVCAAVVVRTFALVAVYMPIQPAPAEASAPTMNATTVEAPSPGEKNRMTIRIPAKSASMRYSRRMNTMAPRWIWSAMFRTFSSPSSYRLTSAYTTNAAKSPIRPSAGGMTVSSNIDYPETC